MAALTIPNSITTDSNIEAAPLAENFSAIAAHANTELVNREGTVAMTAELQLSDGNNAASKVYVDLKATAIMPPGVTVPYAGLVAPAGYLLCDGTAVSRSTYAALFAAVGTTHGAGNGSTTFNVPNLKGRVPVGQEPIVPVLDAVGKVGGERDSVTISHTHGHTIGTTSGGSHVHTVTSSLTIRDLQTIANVGGFPTSGDPGYLFGNTASVGRLPVLHSAWNNGTVALASLSAGSHNHGVSGGINAAGVAPSDTNLQPFVVMLYIIKT